MACALKPKTAFRTWRLAPRMGWLGDGGKKKCRAKTIIRTGCQASFMIALARSFIMQAERFKRGALAAQQQFDA